MTFDVNNRLTKYEVDSGGLAADTSFVYDADGSRVAVITDSGDATHYIAGIHTHDVAAGIEENSYTFSGVTVGLNDDGVRHHVFTDHLATVTGTLEYGLAVANVERLRYSPYGDKRGITGVVAGDRTYTGQVDDMTATGLMFYNARYYDPVARNFVSPDTIIPDPASTLGWNRYSYVNNNPINYSDPSGHILNRHTIADKGDCSGCSGGMAPPQIAGVTSGGIWTGAPNTVLYFAGNEHTQDNPGADRGLDARVRDMRDALKDLGYDANVVWVVSDEMTTGILGPGAQIGECNDTGTDCSALGHDFETAIAGYAELTTGELTGFAHSQASVHVSVAAGQASPESLELSRLVIAAGTAVDGAGAAALGASDVEVWVSAPVFLDFGSWALAPTQMWQSYSSPMNIRGAQMYDSHYARHADHVDPSHDAFREAMRILAGLGG